MGLQATFAADISAMLTHSGVSVTIGDVVGVGSLKSINAVGQSDGVQYQTRVTTIVVRTGDFTLTSSAEVVADGVTYRLDSWDLEGDGSLTRLFVSRTL